jgi:hypothetical protein
MRSAYTARRNGGALGRAEYHLRAEECHTLAARTADAEHKAMLANMAETWETLAQQREALVARKARIAALEPPAETAWACPRRRRLPPDLGERQVAAVAANVLDRGFAALAPNDR